MALKSVIETETSAPLVPAPVPTPFNCTATVITFEELAATGMDKPLKVAVVPLNTWVATVVAPSFNMTLTMLVAPTAEVVAVKSVITKLSLVAVNLKAATSTVWFPTTIFEVGAEASTAEAIEPVPAVIVWPVWLPVVADVPEEAVVPVTSIAVVSESLLVMAEPILPQTSIVKLAFFAKVLVIEKLEVLDTVDLIVELTPPTLMKTSDKSAAAKVPLAVKVKLTVFKLTSSVALPLNTKEANLKALDCGTVTV